jgi:hypothetical protein
LPFIRLRRSGLNERALARARFISLQLGNNFVGPVLLRRFETAQAAATISPAGPITLENRHSLTPPLRAAIALAHDHDRTASFPPPPRQPGAHARSHVIVTVPPDELPRRFAPDISRGCFPRPVPFDCEKG